jgi:hypothetical protein
MKRFSSKLIMLTMILAIGLSEGLDAQISYAESFNGCNAPSCLSWSISGGYAPSITAALAENYSPCNTASAKARIYSTATTTTLTRTASLGISSGELATATFTYKCINYNNGSATQAGRATFSLEWSPSSSGPWTAIGSSFPNVSSTSCTSSGDLTFTPSLGQNIFLRIRAVRSAGNFWVVIDDITLNQSAVAACAGTPAPGATTGPSSVCLGEDIVLGLTNATTGSGVSYQWYADDGGGNVPVGADSPTLTISQSVATDYYCDVTCSSSSTTSSGVLSVAMSAPAACYCTTVDFTSNVENMSELNFTGIGNTSACGTGGPALEDFTAVPGGAVTAGETYPISASGNTDGGFTNYFTAFFDWDQDGSFETAVPFNNTIFGSVCDLLATGSVTVPLGATLGTTRMRVIKNYNASPLDPCGSYGYGQAEDYSLIVTAPSACQSPSGLDATSITPTGFNAEWMSTNTPTTTYSVYIVVDGGTPTTPDASGTSSNGINSVAVSTFDGSTPLVAGSYDLYVQEDCSGGVGGTSALVGPFDVNVPCSSFSIPFIENFDGAAAPAIPDCWTTDDLNGTSSPLGEWITGTETGFSGLVAGYVYATSQAADDWLISPGLNLTGGTSYTVAYTYAASFFDESLEVFYGTAPSAASMTTEIADNGTFSSATQVTVSYDFTPATTQVYYIGWHAYSAADQNVLFLDDISVEVTPTCFDPTGLIATSISGSAFDAEWTSTNTGLVNYSIFVVQDGGTPVTADETGTANNGFNSIGVTTFDGGTPLLPNSDYDLYLAEDCSGGTGGATNLIGPYSFSTPCGGTPDPGVTTGPATSCEGEDFTLGLTNATPGDGVSYQWYANDGSGAVMLGTNSPILTVNQTTATDYYCAVTCGANTGTSGTLSVGMTVPNECYCTTFSIIGTVENISYVEFAGIENTSDCGTGGPALEDFTSVEGAVIAGETYPLSASGDTDGGFTDYFTAFFDWDHDGVLEDAQPIGTIFDTACSSQATGSVTVPSDALGGSTRMRVVKNWNASPLDPCGSYGYGQAEDYTINVTPLEINDNCFGAIAITPSAWGYPLWDTLSVSGASESLIGCIGTADDDTWYSWVAQSANDVVIVQDIGASSDMVVEIYDGCGGTSLGCYDNYGTGALERAWVGGLTVGNTYYFRTYDKAVGGPASGEIQVIVKTFAIGAIRDIFCGITDYALSDYFTPERQDFNQLYPYTLVATAGYGVRLTDQVTSTAYVKNQIGGYGTQFFQFSDFSGIPFNTLFDAQARHALNIACNGGVSLLWSEYGPSCTMGLGGVTQTQIRAQYCTGAVDYDLFDLIQADVVPEASQYRFIFRENGNTIIRVKNSYSVFLYDVPGLAYGKTYQVTVQVLVNGVWSEEGTSCSINMLTQPPSTSVRQQYCNGTVLYPSSNYILAEVVAGANLHEWRFTPNLGGTSVTTYTTSYSLFFFSSLSLEAGTVYNLEVRARVGTIWGDFEGSCMIFLEPNPGMDAPRDFSEAKWMEQGELSIYPNPNGGEELMIVLTGLSEEEGTVQLELLDMMGRLVQSERISSKGEQISYKMLFEERLPSGLYLLRASQEGMMLTRRLVIE